MFRPPTETNNLARDLFHLPMSYEEFQDLLAGIALIKTHGHTLGKAVTL
jgi:hypothetical protein